MSRIPGNKNPVSVFFSYSHRDEELRNELETHLALLKHEGVIEAWHDRKIPLGSEWAEEISENLNTADIILLLVSPDFLASPYCHDVEVVRAMERNEAGSARVIPVILRPCDWRRVPFGKLQALPKGALPVRKWPDRDDAFLDIAEGIRTAAEDMAAARTARNDAKTDRSPSPEPPVELKQSEAPRVLRAGETIGPYTLLSVIGRGGFGVVWLAERRSVLASTRFALKIPATGTIDIEAIGEEARLWVQASGHPNVLPIIEANIYDEHVVIVSEYAPDGSLKQWLDRNGGTAPSIEEAVRMAEGILSGLEHLHSRGIVHRDLKPDNILLQRNTPRLADFGLSRVLKAGSMSTIVAGTPAYMAPEVFEGKKGTQTDLWAAGVILYQLASGRLPFEGADLPSVMRAILTKDPEPLADKVPAAIRDVVMRALRKEPIKRYASAEQVRTTLRAATDQVLRGAPPSKAEPRPPTQARRSRHTVPATIEFETVQVDKRGKIIERRTARAGYFTEDLGSGVRLDLVEIPSGTFMMGSGSNEADRRKGESPRHEARVPGFYMGKFQVTVGQWNAVAKLQRVYWNLRPKAWYVQGVGDRLPVDNVSWDDASEFCARLSRKTGRPYRLPSEAEWEYACRAGSTTPFAFGETITPEFANYDGTHPYAGAAKGTYRGKRLPVGSLGVANGFGLYDMHGNVWEWCQDVWHENYSGAPTDGSAWETGGNRSKRMMRGGSWFSPSNACRSAHRGSAYFKYAWLRRLFPEIVGPSPRGFRVVLRPSSGDQRQIRTPVL
jgi:formylglycine-generating enzyme required for sulfatase activity